ncbi:hypothetical protein B0H17DRAFT_1125013 [Mycena rosella]|uniref:Uncharacterized protein n=1 Tax=Mycena rosella TaxID=1033263 RepID=A0AAD7GYP2_MYCRO|nr:hypothetical protein B0H17DRAFT_1125013 [Mycena rosella]
MADYVRPMHSHDQWLKLPGYPVFRAALNDGGLVLVLDYIEGFQYRNRGTKLLRTVIERRGMKGQEDLSFYRSSSVATMVKWSGFKINMGMECRRSAQLLGADSEKSEGEQQQVRSQVRTMVMAAPEVGSTFGHLIGVPKKLPYLARATNDNTIKRRTIFAKLKSLSTVAEASVGSSLNTMYSRNGGKAGTYENSYRRQFKNTRRADLSLGAIERFAHLPSNSFLAIFPIKANKAESVKIYANHVEIGSRAYAMFESLMAVVTLNTVRRKGKADISLAELPEDDWVAE